MASFRDTIGRKGAAIAAAAIALAPLRAAPPPPDEAIKPQMLLDHLNAVISWYRETDKGVQWIGRPSDQLYYDVLRDNAIQVVRDAFASAEATARLIPTPAPKPGQTASNSEARAQRRAATTARIAQLQAEINGLNRQSQGPAAGDRTLLDARKGMVQAELDLEKSTLERIDNFDQFATAYSGEAGVGILDQISNLQRSVPDAFKEKPKTGDGSEGTATEPHAIGGASGGLIARAEALWALIGGINGLDELNAAISTKPPVPSQLQPLEEAMLNPLAASMRSMLQESETLSSQNRTTADVGALEDATTQIQDLTDQLKDLSDAVLPLGKERILLVESQQDIAQWRQSLVDQRGEIVRGFAGRALFLLFFIALIFFAAEIARRATYKYIHEPRRRRQFLILRRFLVGLCIALVLVSSFVSDFSSLATYVGLITAGVAVALQSVILSVCAYFMLIGRYGVRVGDRITVMGVTGEVIDLGMVRFYLTELAGTGVDLHPTGRVVVFPNSALFQNAPFYKQLPGTNYTWHEAVVTLAPTADTEAVQKKLLEVVGGVYSEYKPTFEAQHGMVERLIDLHIEVPQPVAQVRYTGDGLQLVLRYPVVLRHADETDGLTIYKLVEAIRSDPKLKEQVQGTPHLQTAVKV